jgi:parallel beta-helix repeat protein
MKLLRKEIGIALLLGVALLLALGAAPPIAAQSDASPDTTEIASCTTIESPGEYTLPSDIADAPEAGCLVITADDVTVDGNGHAITPSESSARGPAVLARGAENVSVRNVRLSGWQVGVVFDRVTRGSVTNVRVSNAAIAGVSIDGASQQVTVADNNVTDATGGVRLTAGSDVDVRDNTLTDLTGAGVRVESDARNATVQNNTVSNTSGTGVRVSAADAVSVVDNDITGAADVGIGVDGATEATIAGNRLDEIPGVGIRVRNAPGAQTRDNVVTNARAGGIQYFDSGDEVMITDSGGSEWRLVPGFAETREGAANGLNERSGVDRWPSETVRRESFVVNNTVDGSYNHGVLVQSTDGIVLSANLVERSDDGIHVTGGSDVAVRRNELHRNDDDGVAFERVSNGAINANSVTNNVDNGIYVVGDENLIIKNVGIQNGDDGVDLQNASGSVIRNNVLSENDDDGLFLRRANNGSVIGNTLQENLDEGIHIKQSNGNVIRDNAICRNADNDEVIGPESQNNEITPGDCSAG